MFSKDSTNCSKHPLTVVNIPVDVNILSQTWRLHIKKISKQCHCEEYPCSRKLFCGGQKKNVYWLWPKKEGSQWHDDLAFPSTSQILLTARLAHSPTAPNIFYTTSNFQTSLDIEIILSLSTLLKAFLIRNAFLVQTQLHCPQVPHLGAWGQRKQEQQDAGGDEVDCPTQLAIPYSFDDTLIVSEQIGKSTAGTSVITLSSSSALRVGESRNSTR